MSLTANEIIEEMDTAEIPWWSDSQNVTFVARWYVDQMEGREAAYNTAEWIIKVYETPWDCNALWVGACEWVIDQLGLIEE